MSLSPVSSYLISKEDPERWQENAACSHPLVNPDWWSSPLRIDQALAVHICTTHCPVLAECRRSHRPGRGETCGGVTYRQTGRVDQAKPLSPQPSPPDSCDICRALG